MEKAHVVLQIERVIHRYNKITGLFSDLEKVFGTLPETPIHDEMWNFFDDYVDAIAKLVGDDMNWINWYIYDNDLGKGKKTVAIDGREFDIETVGQLADVIVEMRDRD